MENQQYPQEDEIDLRDYIDVIIKRKKIILTVFLVSVITTAVISLLQPKVYQATVLIMFTPSKIQNVLAPTQTLDIEKFATTGEYIYITPKLAISFPTHRILLKLDAVLERLINRLDLKNKFGIKLAPEDIFGKLNIKETKDTNILYLQATDTNPKKAMDIANVWAQEYTEYSQELILGEVKGTGNFITDQFGITQQNLIQSEEKVKEFKDKYKLDLMCVGLDIKKEKLNEYKKELIDLEVTFKTKEDSLRELKKEIAKQEKFIIVSKAITDDAFWQWDLKEKDISALNKKKLRSEEINPIYQDLEKRIVDTEIEINTLKPRIEYLNKSLMSTELEINELGKTINQKEFDLTQLTRQVEIYKRTYDNLSSKIEEVRIVKAAQLGEVKIVSSAIEPKYPVALNKRQNVAISGVVSLMFGTFLAFFAEYWEKSKQTSKIKP